MPTSEDLAPKKEKLTLNDTFSLLLGRAMALGGRQMDPRRDLHQECGWPKIINILDYLLMYQTEGIANRVVSIYPDECWAVDPLVFESESPGNTPFEEGFIRMTQSWEANPFHFLHKLDVLSGIGTFGVMLMGFDDGRDLVEPITGGMPGTRRQRNHNLMYLRSFDETQCFVREFDNDPKSPRFGRPTLYTLRLQNIGAGILGTTQPLTFTMLDVLVHWTRLLHASEGAELFAAPRQQPVFYKLLDVRKILGSSAEMFYKGGFPGLSLELDPKAIQLLNVQIDPESLDEQMRLYMNGLQRYISLIGMTAKSLAPQVADPTHAVKTQLESIAMSIGVPLRVFMGSEQAQLASGQDVRTWNRRLRKRQERYLTPMLLRQFIQRCLDTGVLPMPKGGAYNVHWPDVNMPSEEERTANADRVAACMMKYCQSGAWQLMQPSDFLRIVVKLTDEEIAVVMENIEKAPEIAFKPLPGQGGDSGSKDNSPSKQNNQL